MLQGNPFETELEAQWRKEKIYSDAARVERGVQNPGSRYARLKAHIAGFRLPSLHLGHQQPCEGC
jgi:hypothetical protein